jgi:hypothetical protein
MKIYFYTIVLFFLVLLFPLISAELVITEIMYNPSTAMGSDSDLEWIEVHNSGTNSFELINFTINNKKIDDLIVGPKEYFIIARELVDGSDKDEDCFESLYGNNDCSWNSTDGNYKAVDAGSFNLKNKKDEIVLTNGDLEIKTNYSKALGGNGNGHSIEYVNNLWLESKEVYGTPGRKNTADPNYVPPQKRDVKLSVYLDDQIYTQYSYDDLFKIKFLEKDNCSDKEIIKVHYYLLDENNQTIFENNFIREKIGCSTYSNTGELLLKEGGEFVLCGEVVDLDFEDINLDNNFVCQNIEVIDTSKIPCDLNLEIVNEKLFYSNKERVGFYNQLNEEIYPFTIEYWVEDLFENKIKNKVVTKNTNKKSYTPNIDEEDRVLYLKSEVKPLCNDSNHSNNFAEKMLIVVNNQINSQSGDDDSAGNSKIEIKKITPAETTFGDLVKAEIEVYKGNTNKYSLTAYIEKEGKKISETTKINLKDKFTDYKITLPIQLKPNCNLVIKEGEANLIVSGLGETDEMELLIEGVDKTLCRDYLSYVKELKKEENNNAEGGSNKLSYKIVDLPKNIFAGEKLNVKLNFQGDNSEHEFKVWAYLYRGSKCYSCCSDCEVVLERDDNLIEFDLSENTEKEVKLLVPIDSGIAEGEYNLKIKINKDQQKTNQEITAAIIVKENEELKLSEKTNQITGMAVTNFAAEDNFGLSAEELRVKESSKGIVVYESSSKKAQKVIPYLLIIILGLVCFVLIFKKI